MLLAVLVFNTVQRKLSVMSEELSLHYQTMLRVHHRAEQRIQNDAIIFIGDSITQDMDVSRISSNAVNFGIGGDTTYGVLQRIPEYKSLKFAECIVLAIGINDFERRDNAEIAENHKLILKTLPENKSVVISAILPVEQYNNRIAEINLVLEKMASQSQNIIFLDAGKQMTDNSGNLRRELHVGDGIHLSNAGYDIWVEELKKCINK